MKKIVLMMAAGALLVCMASCHKDEETNTNTNTTPQDTTQTTTQKHNVELVMSNSNAYENIAMDTIRKYNTDPTVDTIFMVPERYNMWSSTNTTGLQATVNYLRERKNVNPNKVWGKGELQLKQSSVANNPEIFRFFRDTLGYTITYNYSKN